MEGVCERLVLCVKIITNGHLYWWANTLQRAHWMNLEGSLVLCGTIWQRERPHSEGFVRQHHKRGRAGLSDYIGIPCVTFGNTSNTSRLKKILDIGEIPETNST